MKIKLKKERTIYNHKRVKNNNKGDWDLGLGIRKDF